MPGLAYPPSFGLLYALALINRNNIIARLVGLDEDLPFNHRVSRVGRILYWDQRVPRRSRKRLKGAVTVRNELVDTFDWRAAGHSDILFFGLSYPQGFLTCSRLFATHLFEGYHFRSLWSVNMKRYLMPSPFFPIAPPFIDASLLPSIVVVGVHFAPNSSNTLTILVAGDKQHLQGPAYRTRQHALFIAMQRSATIAGWSLTGFYASGLVAVISGGTKRDIIICLRQSVIQPSDWRGFFLTDPAASGTVIGILAYVRAV
ncbi:hypothetical protein B0H15DRAFT_797181 [Mycena belliarum]|uniref:Uncharacterized protein n=1 Tax=Mycena belliarum TaxID=1033014 RepID=A0AAD6UEB3_9AGAR|nr:hypothetical protein B0H15DRAFT_797181 [Mycena belliae]